MMDSNGPVLDGVLSSVDVSLEEPLPVVDNNNNNNNNNIPKSEEATADQSQIQSQIPIQSSIDKKKKYICEICKIASFTRKHNLKSHLLTHTDSKPFQCSYCSSNFRRNYDLKRHEKIHTKEKPYICLKCGKSFSRADTLLRHNSSNTGCNLNNKSITNDNNNDTNNDTNNNTKKRKPRSKTSIKSLKKQKRIDDNQINKDITTLIPLNDETNFFAQHSIENNNNNNNNNNNTTTTTTTTIPSNFEEIVKISSLINEVVSKSSDDSNGINESLTEGQSIILKKALTLLGDIETRLKKPETELDSQSTEPQLQPEQSEQLEITKNQLDQQQSHIQTALDNMNDSIQPELIN